MIHIHARQLRNNPSKAERLLWYFLRQKQLADNKFRRQFPIGHYIVDFICLKKKLIIELDGGQHSIQIRYDSNRTQWLQSKGYTVLRFWNNEVLGNTEEVVGIVLRHL